MVERRARRRRPTSTTSNVSPRVEVDGLEHGPHVRPRPRPGVRSGANRWLSEQLDPIGHHVAGHPALDRAPPAGPRGSWQPVEHRLARLVGRRGRPAAGRARWMALRPIQGRAVWARSPASVDRDPHGALAAGLDDRRRSARPAGRRRRPAGRGGRSMQLEQAAAVGRDLLAGVEHVGHVDRRVGARCGPARASRPGRSSCRWRRGRYRRSPSMRAPLVAVGRHGVGVAGEHQAHRRGRGRCGPPGCRRPGSSSSQGTRRSSRLEVGDEGLLVAAHRRDVDQLGGQGEEVGHGGRSGRWRRGRGARR